MLKLVSLLGLIVSTVAGGYFLFCLGLVYSHNSLQGAKERMIYFGLLSLASGVVWLGCLILLLREFKAAAKMRRAGASGD